MRKILISTAIALTLMLLPSAVRADHETTDNMFTFHAWCNMLSQNAVMADNYKACVTNQDELFGQFDDIIKYLAARDQHRASMVKFLDALPVDSLSTEAILNILYTTRDEI